MPIERSPSYRPGQPDNLKDLKPEDFEEILANLDALDKPPAIPILFRSALRDIIDANSKTGLDELAGISPQASVEEAKANTEAA